MYAAAPTPRARPHELECVANMNARTTSSSSCRTQQVVVHTYSSLANASPYSAPRPGTLARDWWAVGWHERSCAARTPRMLFRSPTDQPPPPEEEASFQVALQQTPAERSAAKAAAVEACSAEQLALLQCYRQGSLLACTSAREAFWACYKRQRVRARASCHAGSHASRARCRTDD